MAEVMEGRDITILENPVIGQMTSYDHEQVVFCQDNETGLKAIIAIHDTTLGPALGGTRMWNYKNELEALNDVLRLSRGMTYKAAITGLNLGGGKAVIIGDSRTQKTEGLFRRFGQFVNSLNGKYITAEDVGISTKDMEYVKMETDHVAGLPASMGGTGDPSPVTAYGVYMGMKAAAKVAFGSDNLEGKRIVVQGVGHVGEYLVKYLTEEKAIVFVSDIHEDTVNRIVAEYGATAIGVNDVYDVEMDIYSPCALGATVNDETLEKLTCKVIAGAANNQLANEVVHGKAVMDKGIIYAPDFLINAGGLINCYAEVKSFSTEEAIEQAKNIYQTTLDIIAKSKAENIPTYLAANQLAEQRILAAKN